MPTHLRDRARELRREETEAEHLLWKRLRNRQLAGVKFRRQHPIGPFIADLCCVDAKLVIELDGEPHASHDEYDRERTEHLEARGYRVLRFWNDEVLANPEAVLKRIEELLAAHLALE